MTKQIAILLLLLMLPTTSYGWGKRGHDVIAHIAECHLTKGVLEGVTELLDGRSMVYYANWMDSASRTAKYRDTYTWHYFNMEMRDDCSTAKRERHGDLLTAAEELEARLRDESLTREERGVALRMYIHIIGDMHQPMHIGREEDHGGGDIPVVYFVESTSLHAVWDYHIVEGCHSWSYSEWQQQIDRLNEAEVRAVTAGGYAEWIDATHEVTREIYRRTPAEHRIFYEYVDHFTPIVEQQLLYAGLRLAAKLNMIIN